MSTTTTADTTTPQDDQTTDAGLTPEVAAEPEKRISPLEGSMRWYVLHVYSGFEQKVSNEIREKAEKQGLEDNIGDILIPKEEISEIKRGKRVSSERNIFPGYVMIRMALSDDAWHLIKNTNKVTGFLGSGNKPQAISEGEAKRLIQQLTSADGPTTRRTITFDVGEEVRINEGAFASMMGVVDEVDDEKEKLKISVSIFGRATPVELDFAQVEKTT